MTNVLLLSEKESLDDVSRTIGQAHDIIAKKVDTGFFDVLRRRGVAEESSRMSVEGLLEALGAYEE